MDGRSVSCGPAAHNYAHGNITDPGQTDRCVAICLSGAALVGIGSRRLSVQSKRTVQRQLCPVERTRVGRWRAWTSSTRRRRCALSRSYCRTPRSVTARLVVLVWQAWR